MCARLVADNNPNLLLLNYDLKNLGVTNLFVVPKQFFVREVIEERKPLALTARRAGWVGCNILLSQIPSSGKVFFVRDRQHNPKTSCSRSGRGRFFCEMRHLMPGAGS